MGSLEPELSYFKENKQGLFFGHPHLSLRTEIGCPFHFQLHEGHNNTFNHSICNQAEHPLPVGDGCCTGTLGKPHEVLYGLGEPHRKCA